MIVYFTLTNYPNQSHRLTSNNPKASSYFMKVSSLITVMHCAAFFLSNEDKLSNHSRSCVAGHSPAPAS